MTNEIKEILYLEKYIDKYKSDEKSIINGNRLTTPAMLDYLEVKSLLDYITNLQQRIDKAIEYIDSYCLEEDGYVGYGDDLNPRELVNILRGDE